MASPPAESNANLPSSTLSVWRGHFSSRVHAAVLGLVNQQMRSLFLRSTELRVEGRSDLHVTVGGDASEKLTLRDARDTWIRNTLFFF